MPLREKKKREITAKVHVMSTMQTRNVKQIPFYELQMLLQNCPSFHYVSVITEVFDFQPCEKEKKFFL